MRAADVPELREFLQEGLEATLRSKLENGERMLIEGTQGFGLSIWRSDHFPFATSRDTGAAAFVAEAGLAPHDVDEVVMVMRAFPIRVGGNSGPLVDEIDWPTLAAEAHLPRDYCEYTSATGRVRRIGRFDPGPIRSALAVNAPHVLVINHMDYVDPTWHIVGPTAKSRNFLANVEHAIGREIHLLGYGAAVLMPRLAVMLSEAA
jgi:adenylosuccinate synthase